MDVTGVADVDSTIAGRLIGSASAARLMGATVILTGLSSQVARSLASLDVDLGQIVTMGDLQSGIETAERLLGYQLFSAGAGIGAAEQAPA